MVTGILQSLLPAFLLTVSLTSSSTSQPSIAKSEFAPLPLASFSALLSTSTFYVVKDGDTLASIAKQEYGNEHYWSTIWNDNTWISDPNLIETGWKFSLRIQPPTTVEELKPGLMQKLTVSQPLDNKVEDISLTAQTQSKNQITTAVISATSGPLTEAQISFLGKCESGMTAGRNSGNGYFGAFQFSPGTWNSMNTGYARADLAPVEVQKDAVQRLVSRSSIFSQFPGCSAQMHASGIL